jgi:hypothetical protein
VSDNERDQQDDSATTEEDAKEDLELKDEDADQVRGGLASKTPKWESTDQVKDKW